MLTVLSTPLELRGIVNKTTKAKDGKDSKVYYVLNVESSDGSPHALYCPNVDALPPGLSKGDMVTVTFDVFYFNGKERLVVSKVVKAE